MPYIDKDETIKVVREQYLTCDTDTDYNRGIQQGFDFAMSVIRNQPTADVVEVKHGEWLGQEFYDLCACSNCNKYFIDCGDKYDFNFCPHCGADMRKRRESE